MPRYCSLLMKINKPHKNVTRCELLSPMRTLHFPSHFLFWEQDLWWRDWVLSLSLQSLEKQRRESPCKTAGKPKDGKLSQAYLAGILPKVWIEKEKSVADQKILESERVDSDTRGARGRWAAGSVAALEEGFTKVFAARVRWLLVATPLTCRRAVPALQQGQGTKRTQTNNLACNCSFCIFFFFLGRFELF